MSSDNDDDFNPTAIAPSKKVKKNSNDDKEKGKKNKREKSSSSKNEKKPESPKRKTPIKKKAEKKEPEKKDAKKPEKKPTKAKAVMEEEEFKESFNNDDNDGDSFNPNEELSINQKAFEDFDDEDEDSEKEKSKKKKESKAGGGGPKGKKGGKGVVHKEEGYDEILDYLKKQNRPYSLINIFDNLHGKIKKAQCQRALDLLTEAGEIQMKEYGKAKIYLLNQKNIPDIDEKQMDDLKKKLNAIKEKYTRQNDELKEMNALLKDLLGQPTNNELEKEIEKYTTLIEESKQKLTIYESPNYPKISDDEIKKVEDKKKGMETEYKKRKRICMDMIGQLADSAEKKLSVMIEEIGIEPDT